MMGYSASVMLIIAGIAFLLGKLLRLERTSLTAVVLTSLFANNGNYGLPLIAFAFGQEALAYASIYFVTNSLLLYTVGVLIASLGHLRLKEALLGLLKVPAIYAILLAVIFIRTGWTLACAHPKDSGSDSRWRRSGHAHPAWVGIAESGVDEQFPRTEHPGGLPPADRTGDRVGHGRLIWLGQQRPQGMESPRPACLLQ